MKNRVLFALSLLLVASACHTTHEWRGEPSSSGHRLGSVEVGEGEVRTYTLHYGDDHEPTIQRTIERSFQVARLGVDVRSVDGRLAEEFGFVPWKGVYVDYVADDSAASRAGLARGDLLLEVAGTPVTSREQFIELVESRMRPGVESEMTVSSITADGTRATSLRRVVPGVREVEESATETIELTAPEVIERRTGIQLTAVPEDLAEEIWADGAPHVYISGVLVGSPAYHAGLRGGDRLVGVGGEPVSSPQDVARAIEGGASSLELSVVGPHDSFDGKTNVVPSLPGTSNFYIPLIVNYSSRMDRKRISFLDIIFQFGFTYRGTYEPSLTREPAKRTFLSILPLGMFEFERSPTYSRNTLFWFITWRNRR